MADRWDLLLHSVFISREKFSNPSWQVSSGGAHAFSLCLCVCVCVCTSWCASLQEGRAEMLVAVSVVHRHQKSRVRNGVLNDFSPEGNRQDSVLNLTHVLLRAEDGGFV